MQLQLSVAAARKTFDVDAMIVDLDGTMVDTMGDFVQAITYMLQDLQLPQLGAQDVAHMVGKGTEHLLRSALARVVTHSDSVSAHVPAAVEALFPQALERYTHHYLAINGQYSQVYPGVLEGLAGLRQAGLRLACVTNKPVAFTLPLLAAKGLEGLFDVVFGGDSFERKKPDPLPLLKACEALGTTPERTLMLGDSSNDALAARAAGCPVLLMTYGYNHGQPVDSVDADGLMDSMTQLQVVA